MPTVTMVLMLTGIYPLYRAWASSRATTLPHALAWLVGAWISWVPVALGAGSEMRYVALVLTACAGVATLEPRQPGVAAWHFVTGGLLCVLALPLAQGWGRLDLGPEWAVFLAAVLGVGCLNYLPTRLGVAAALVLAACGYEVWGLANPEWRPGWARLPGPLAVGVAPWAGLLAVALAPRGATEFDRVWRGFRDRFGGLWALRVCEQFNRAAANAGWSLRLGWGGAAPGDDPLVRGEGLMTLRALLKRFGPSETAQ